jgi:hypothetical protein
MWTRKQVMRRQDQGRQRNDNRVRPGDATAEDEGEERERCGDACGSENYRPGPAR